MFYFVKNFGKIILKCKWGPKGVVNSVADSWESPGGFQGIKPFKSSPFLHPNGKYIA